MKGWHSLLAKAWIILALSSFPVGGVAWSAAPPEQNHPAWQYTLIEGSSFVDDCRICGRPTILLPMRGKFQLRLLAENPLFSRYAVENISFIAGRDGGGLRYEIKGNGTFEIGGEVALRLEMCLQVEVDDGSTSREAFFTNVTSFVERRWPMIYSSLEETNGTLLQVFTMTIAAAPLREIWFSTVNGFTPSAGDTSGHRVSAADLLSSIGRIVKPHQALISRLGVMPTPSDVLGLDAVDILPGGEIAFSVGEDDFSETLGRLRHGDLLSNRGRIVKRNQELTAAFGPMPVAPDVGLDGVQILDTGEIYFSIETNLFSERLGIMLRRGDLLSSDGRIVQSNEQLLSRFQLPPAAGPLIRDFGLDAIFVWPNGEVWFSTEEGFQTQKFGPIHSGDLLSDWGYIVFRNLELLSPFAPVEDLADFGLDGLFIVTDVLPSQPAPRFTRVHANRVGGHLRLEWDGMGRVFQIERSGAIRGDFVPWSPILSDLQFEASDVPDGQSFFRLRQW